MKIPQRLPRRLRASRKILSVVLIVVFAYFSLVTFPYTPSHLVPRYVTSWFKAPSQPSTVGTQITLANTPLKGTFPVPAAARTLNLTFTLSGGPLVVGTPLNLTVVMQADFGDVVAENVKYVIVSLDNALIFPFVNESLGAREGGFGNVFQSSFNSIKFDVANVSHSCSGSCSIGEPSSFVFNGTEQVKFTIAGSFGATVYTVPLVSNNTNPAFDNVSIYHSNTALFSIASYNTVLAQTNQQLTVCLTFVVIVFSAIAIYPDDGPPPPTKNGKPKNAEEDFDGYY